MQRKGSLASSTVERGAALSVGGKQPWAGLSWMCVGTRHLRRFNHYRQITCNDYANFTRNSLHARPMKRALSGPVWSESRQRTDFFSGVELSSDEKAAAVEEWKRWQLPGSRILYLRAGLDPRTFSRRRGSASSTLQNQKRSSREQRKISPKRKKKNISMFWNKSKLIFGSTK